MKQTERVLVELRRGLLCGRFRPETLRHFAEKVEIDPSGCWLWRGYVSDRGYGFQNVRGLGRKGPIQAHRLAYEMAREPIPEGLVIDHLCRVRSCVNPAHLEVVTPLENHRRGVWSFQTHCLNGHPKTPENRINRKRGGGECRECHRIQENARNIRRRAA